MCTSPSFFKVIFTTLSLRTFVNCNLDFYVAFGVMVSSSLTGILTLDDAALRTQCLQQLHRPPVLVPPWASAHIAFIKNRH